MYRPYRHPAIVHEAARVADEQLALALADIRRAGTGRGDAVHSARRHIRNLRALMRMLRPLLGDGPYAESTRRLRALTRRLAPVADGAAVLHTLAQVSTRADAANARPAIAALRQTLVQRAERIARVTSGGRLLRQSELAIAVERARIGTWQLKKRDVGDNAPEVQIGARRAAAAMARALAHPTQKRDHAWRRHAAEWWLHVRLLEGRHRELSALRQRLEAMDDALDEAHNVAVLERILVTEGLESRRDTATMLRLLRHYQGDVRARAVAHGRAALGQASRVPVPPRRHTRIVAAHLIDHAH